MGETSFFMSMWNRPNTDDALAREHHDKRRFTRAYGRAKNRCTRRRTPAGLIAPDLMTLKMKAHYDVTGDKFHVWIKSTANETFMR